MFEIFLLLSCDTRTRINCGTSSLPHPFGPKPRSKAPLPRQECHVLRVLPVLRQLLGVGARVEQQQQRSGVAQVGRQVDRTHASGDARGVSGASTRQGLE